MADWTGMSRSNYFCVKDEASFRGWAEDLELVVIADDDDKGRFGFYSNTDDGGWPTLRIRDGAEEDEEVDIAAELACHLADGEVAVLLSIGHEKARYVSGYAVAVNSAGMRVVVYIGEIYEKAASAFSADVGGISEAAY